MSQKLIITKKKSPILSLKSKEKEGVMFICNCWKLACRGQGCPDCGQGLKKGKINKVIPRSYAYYVSN